MHQNFIPAVPKKGQEEYVKSLQENVITFCEGYPGTGKTFLALSEALRSYYDTKNPIKRIIIIRPYMPSITGEKIGALPGTLDEKVLPYVESIKDNLREFRLKGDEIKRLLTQVIEFTVLSMCRGRSFNDAFVIVEEAQNVPLSGDAMKMLVTRIGKNCRMAIAGDLDQCDIDPLESGMAHAMSILDDLDGIGVVEMKDITCIYRNPIIGKIMERFEKQPTF